MSEEATGLFGLSVGFSTVIVVIGVIWWILCIILFFKIWAMTNDISRIRDVLEEWLDLEHPEVDESEEVPTGQKQK